jgi:hypothetical protein
VDSVGGFSPTPFSHSAAVKTFGVAASRKSISDDRDECCEMCSDTSNSCCYSDGDAVDNNNPNSRRGQSRFNPIIHTSRRKFVQFAAAFGSAAFTSSAYGAEYNSYVSSVSTNKDIIAVQIGRLAPFSSTRQYRTIVLSNGEFLVFQIWSISTLVGIHS